MFFLKTPLSGDARIIEIEPKEDNRGLFARTFCQKKFAAEGLDAVFVQQSTSYNDLAGTVRGMHWQSGDDSENKLVRVTRGRV